MEFNVIGVLRTVRFNVITDGDLDRIVIKIQLVH